MPNPDGSWTNEEWAAYQEAQARSEQARIDAEERMNNARVGVQYATTAMQVAEARYEFDQAFNNLSADQKEKYAYLRETFYTELAEKQREFDIGNYSDLAKSLLAGASQLQGPQDWLSYAEYTSGGRDIMKALYGDQAQPAFGAPTGYSAPSSVAGILAQLGITMAPKSGTGTSTPGANPVEQQNAYLDWIWANAAAKGHDLAGFYGANGWKTDSPEAQRAIVRDWITKADPQWKGKTAEQVAQVLGYQAPTTAPTPAAPPAGELAPPLPAGAANNMAAQGVGIQPVGGITPFNPPAQPGSGLANPTVTQGGPGPRPVGGNPQPNIGTGTAQPVTPQQPAAPAQPSGNWYQDMKGWYSQFTQQNGRAPTRDEWAAAFTQRSGQSNAVAQLMYQRGTDYIAGNNAAGYTGPTKYADEATQNQWIEDINKAMVPLPHQINPAVWNAMSPSAQKMALASAQKGYTPSGAWDAGDYLTQMQNAAPKGTAPKRTSTNWGALSSSY